MLKFVVRAGYYNFTFLDGKEALDFAEKSMIYSDDKVISVKIYLEYEEDTQDDIPFFKEDTEDEEG